MGEVGDADILQNGHRFGLRRPLGRKVAANVQGRLQQRIAAGPVEPDHHILQHRHRVKQPDILEGAGDPGVHHLVGLQPLQRGAREGDAAAGGLIVGGDDVKQGGLTRAVRADKAKDLRLVNMEADVVDGPQAAKLHGDVLHLQDDFIFRHSRRSFFRSAKSLFSPAALRGRRA